MKIGKLDDPAEQPEIFPRVRDEIKERVTQLIESVNNPVLSLWENAIAQRVTEL